MGQISVVLHVLPKIAKIRVSGKSGCGHELGLEPGLEPGHKLKPKSRHVISITVGGRRILLALSASLTSTV